MGDSPAILNDKVDWKLTPISTEQATGYALSWTASGKLLQVDGSNHVYITGGDGSNRVRVLADSEMTFSPSACGPGEVVDCVPGSREQRQPTSGVLTSQPVS